MAKHIVFPIIIWCIGITILPVNGQNGTVCNCVLPIEPPRPFYELFPQKGYYKLHTNEKTWHEAKLICENEGAHLAIINSLEEVKILQELRRRLPNLNGNWKDSTLYIGINDVQYEGVWKTIFNLYGVLILIANACIQTIPLSQTGYSRWDTSQPDNGENGNCGTLRTTTGKLHDIACTATLGFYCELEV